MDSTTLDRTIMDAVTFGHNTFSSIAGFVSGKVGRDVTDPDGADGMQIDRRLQRLRKQGRIEYRGRVQGWHLGV